MLNPHFGRPRGTGLTGLVEAVFSGLALLLRVLLVGWLIRHAARAGCGLAGGLLLGCGPLVALVLLLAPLLLVSVLLQLLGLS
jgi:hypothetical protein